VPRNRLKALPAAIGRLPKLNSLDVSENQLTDLPVSMKAMSSLRALNASFNRLGQLPDAIAELPRLCDVDASSNVLTALPVSWGNKSSCDGLSVYAASLGRCASLPSSRDATIAGESRTIASQGFR
jgi:Leucine-rich repeat (LRR) protein